MASIGSRSAAFLAGYQPKNTPVTVHTAKERNTLHGWMKMGQWATPFTIKLAPHLLGPIAIAAYSYMALVPVIIPLVVKLLCSKKELMINMKEQEKLYPSKTEIKNLRVLKIIFPIAVTTIVALFVPTAVPLIGMLMFGNLIKEIGTDTSLSLIHI